MQAVPDAGVLPLAQSAPGGVPGSAAQLLGQVPPAAAGVEDKQDPFQRGPILDPGPPTRATRRWPGRDQRLDQFPESILDQPLLPAPRHDRRRSTIDRSRSRSDTPRFETRSKGGPAIGSDGDHNTDTDELIPLTANEIRRLLAHLVLAPIHRLDRRLSWSR